jgi:hypothetical protein
MGRLYDQTSYTMCVYGRPRPRVEKAWRMWIDRLMQAHLYIRSKLRLRNVYVVFFF